jgi:hypothetical protein
MSSGDLRVTEVDRSYLDPETQAAALRYLERTGNADVAAALGLADPPPAPEVGYVVVNGRTYCATCRCRTRADGICRRDVCKGGAR